MDGKTEYSSVPQGDLENYNNQKKYTVNQKPSGLVISKALCTLMAIGALLLAILVGLLVFFLVPRCSQASPESLTSRKNYNGSVASIIDMKTPKSTVDENIDERLPDTLEPLHYWIQIMPFLNISTTTGRVSMLIKVKKPTDRIIFHVKDIDINKDSLKVHSVTHNKSVNVKDQNYISGEKYQVILNERLEKDALYTLEMLFLGQLSSHLQGFYRVEYKDSNNGVTKYLASTQFSPTDARRAFPCFDEPSYKANFTITVGRPRNYTSLSNMPLADSPQNDEAPDWVWDKYNTTPKMPSYLVAFIVSDLQAYGSSDRLLKIWATQDVIYQTRYAAELAPKMLHYFEDYFSIKFPLPKIDIVAVPDFGFNAMENWGLITFRESSLLYNDQNSNVDDKRTIATVLGHEIAHQWFGNLVTPKWWKDLWLKEGFATYLQYMAVDHAQPTWNIKSEFIISERTRAFLEDSYESSRPISFEVKNNRQIRQTFDALSYAKGACIIRMLNGTLGEETFKKGLIEFLNSHKFGNADRKDLFDTLTKVAHEQKKLDPNLTINEVMDSWTDKPGFPVVTALMDHSNKTLILSQKRFLYTSNKNDKSTWYIPISIRTRHNSGNESWIWMKNEPTLTIELYEPDWYLLNENDIGYYIVNYDEQNWRLLVSNIMQFEPSTRARLISDSMDLARANLLDYDIPLKMVAKMAVYDDRVWYIPTSVAFNKLEYIDDMLSSTPIYNMLEEFRSSIFRDTFSIVEGMTSDFDDDYLQQNIRRTVLRWACKRSYSQCANQMHLMFRKWMENSVNIPANLREIVYCTAIREGAEAEWNFAYENYLRTNLVSERKVLLNALACTTKKWLLAKYLNLLIEDKSPIKIQDAGQAFEAVASNSISNSMAFDFLRTNWNNLKSRMGEGFNILSKMVLSLPKYMNTEYQLAELIRFKEDMRDNLGTTTQAFDIVIEKVRGNVQWMKKNYKSIEQWLNDHRHNYNFL